MSLSTVPKTSSATALCREVHLGHACIAWEISWHFAMPSPMSVEIAEKFHTDDVSLPRPGWCFWLLEANFPSSMPNQKHYLDLGSDSIVISMEFLGSFLRLVSWGNHWWGHEMCAVFSGCDNNMNISSEGWKKNNKKIIAHLPRVTLKLGNVIQNNRLQLRLRNCSLLLFLKSCL